MNEKVDQTYTWYFALDKGESDNRAIIESKLANTTEPSLRRELLTILGLENIRLEDVEGNIRAAMRAVQEFPDDPLLLNSLSGAYSYFSYNLPRAMEVIDDAVRVARKTGQARRQILHSKARLLRDMKDYEALENCLLEIISEPSSNTADIAKEDDFVKGLPPGVISEDVLKSYADFIAQ
jgi:hypothetical protein